MKIQHSEEFHRLLKTGLIFFVLLQILFDQMSLAAPAGLQKKAMLSHIHLQNNQHRQFSVNKKQQRSFVSSKESEKRTVNGIQTNDDSSWSNAFNFDKLWGAEVDPRTGILTVHFKAGALLSNLGHGPNIDLQINYNSNTLADPDKLGAGWSWNLSHFNAETDQLTTSFGHNFYLQQQGKYHWIPLYHKLQDIRIEGDKSTHFTITYANGLRETLSHEGYETRLEQQNGWGVNFLYETGTNLLKGIVDDKGNKVTINRKRGSLDIISSDSVGKPVIVRIQNKNNQPDEIIFSANYRLFRQGIQINYQNKLLTQIIYLNGLKKTFTYDCSEMRLPSAGLLSDRSLCVVSCEEADPGAGQPVMKTRYAYSRTNANTHNYLGFNSGLTFISGFHEDLLFEAPVDYTYRTMTTNDIVREEHIYNKYHLLTDDKLISNHTGRILSETQNFYCDTDKLNTNCAHTRFEDLPPTYTLPLKTVTRVWGTSSVTPAINTVITKYDNEGRTVNQTDAYGRTTHVQYCPVSGDTACPAMPEGWPFGTLPESVTVYPAATTQTSPPVVTTYNYYRKQINHRGKGYILVLDHQVKQADHQRMISISHYYNNTNDLFTYGLLKQTELTDNTTRSEALSSVIHHYYYTENSKDHYKTTYSTIELGQGKIQKSSAVTTSLYTNQILARTDPSGNNITRYHYDPFGRLISKDIAAGTSFAVTLYYQYVVSPEHNQIITTAANGLQQKITFDNMGRILMFFNEAISTIGKAEPGHWLPKKSIRYDAYGRVIEQQTYTINSSDKTDVIKTVKDYDDMGRLSHVYLPDGETAFILYNDANRCMVSYRQNMHGKRSAITIVKGNVLDKPIEERLIPATSDTLPSVQTLCRTDNNRIPAKIATTIYDGFGRPVLMKDALGRIVRNSYDAFAHLKSITDPAGNIVHMKYNLNGQVIEKWVSPVNGGRYLLASARYDAAGKLLWKAGEDGKKTTLSYTQDGRLASIMMPSGHRVSWRYNVLGLPVIKYLDDQVLLQSEYDPVTVRPVKKTDNTGITMWRYSADNLPEQLIHQGKNGYPDYKLLWHYDRNRRIVSVTDVSDHLTLKTYDKFGRVSLLSYLSGANKKTLSHLMYDDFSRPTEIDYGSGMRRKIFYDHWGHQKTVTDTLNNKLLFHWQFTYDLNDNIITLSQQAENHQQAILNYQYDALNNLVSMRCDGTSGLALCPRDTSISGSDSINAPVITQQNYSFSPLNQMAQVKEVLQDPGTKKTLSKMITYGYGNFAAPLRLQFIKTQWNQKSAVVQNFAYDKAGNMTTEGKGNQITYNAFNQVIHVTKVSGEQSHYTYDGSGKEILESDSTGKRYLFYRGQTLINEQISGKGGDRHVIGYHGIARTIDGMLYEYEETNYKGDITGILTRASTKSNEFALHHRNVYAPYGMVWHSPSAPHPFYQPGFLGFDGQRTDPVTGWQFLGQGRRTYNPEQRYFMSEDPAGSGYAFGNNNPVMHTDPTGSLSKSVRTMFKVMGYIGTLGFSAIHQQWARIVGYVAMGGFCVGATAITIAFKSPLLAIFSTMATGVPACFSVVSTIYSPTHGIGMAAAVVGLVPLVITIAAFSLIAGSYAFPLCCNFLKATGSAEEMLEMAEPPPPLAEVLKQHFPHLVKPELDGDYLSITNFAEMKQIYRTLANVFQVPDHNDTGILLVASLASKRSLSIDKLSMMLGVKNGVTAFGQKYSVIFRNILNDLSVGDTLDPLSSVSTGAVMTDQMTMWSELFPYRYAATVVINEKSRAFVQLLWSSHPANINVNIFTTCHFETDGSVVSIDGPGRDILENFIGEGDNVFDVLVDEYYRIA